MWIANITAVASDEIASIAKVTIEYSDGVRNKIITERISDPDSIKKIVLDGINELNRIDAINELIANPPVGEVDLSIPQPTQEQLDEQAYQQKKQQLIQAKQDLDLGLITQIEFDNILSETQALKPVK